MKNFFKNKKKLLFIILFILATISVLFIYYQSKNNNIEPIATPIPVKFELLKEIPSSGSISTILPTSAIEFDFSKPIDPNSIIVIVKPNIAFTFETSADKKILYLKSNPVWEVNKQYVISLDLKSTDGENLPEKINYSLKITKMTDSNLTEPKVY